MSEYAIRVMDATDLDFVQASWLKSFWDGCVRHARPRIEKETYHRGQRALIRNLMTDLGAAGYVAAVPDAEDVVLGWAVGRPNTLDYVYVKDAFRGLGIARALVEVLALGDAPAFTHVTRRGRELAPAQWSFNPYLLARQG